MDRKYSVTIIIATYNPEWNKFKSTLLSAICQEDIDFEVLITDDGSEIDCFENCKLLFEKEKFFNYKFIKNPVNVGTVKNIYGALQASSGEYVFMTSPGYMLYDQYTLTNLYNFAINKNAQICFGDAIYYSNENNKFKIINNYTNAPWKQELYDQNTSMYLQKAGFFFGGFILGASFFRKRELALKYIGKLVGISKYTEDNTSMAFVLADNIRTYHYNNYVVWYEYGTGVSTSKSKKWEELIEKDFNASYKLLEKEYLQENILRICINSLNYKSKFLKATYIFFHNPFLLLTVIKIKLMRKSIGPLHKIDFDYLKTFYDVGDDYANH